MAQGCGPLQPALPMRASWAPRVSAGIGFIIQNGAAWLGSAPTKPHWRELAPLLGEGHALLPLAQKPQSGPAAVARRQLLFPSAYGLPNLLLRGQCTRQPGLGGLIGRVRKMKKHKKDTAIKVPRRRHSTCFGKRSVTVPLEKEQAPNLAPITKGVY